VIFQLPAVFHEINTTVEPRCKQVGMFPPPIASLKIYLLHERRINEVNLLGEPR
jgi:hypothetical protein